MITPEDPDETPYDPPLWPLWLFGFAMLALLALIQRAYVLMIVVALLAGAFFLAPILEAWLFRRRLRSGAVHSHGNHVCAALGHDWAPLQRSVGHYECCRRCKTLRQLPI